MRGSSEQWAGTAILPIPTGDGSLLEELKILLLSPIVRLLILTFVGANFVAIVFLTWMPSFLYGKFHMSLSMAGLNGTMYLQLSSIAGAFCGGLLADILARRLANGRMLTQALGLFLGIPFLFFTGWAASVPAVVLGMIGDAWEEPSSLIYSLIWPADRIYDYLPRLKNALVLTQRFC